ncbi:MAG: Unknown protein [uncultured Sulfurovum sp.]|uniref:Lipoprotein n=1 Tax=uncultured Sulfurovum sp. TaxID=269237 RepID=A0A6S6U017_9BACT|nr:MAG: Unknown protein [uncultured Sulfurovum sp.]
MKFLKPFLLTISLFVLTACSPKYEIKTHYTLPLDMQGKACVQTCSNERKICQANCNAKQEQCLITAKQEAQNAFPSLMGEYEDIFNEYQYAIDNYNREMDSWTREERRVHQDFKHYRNACNKKQKTTYECRRSDELKRQLRNLEDREPIAPKRPIKPTLVSEIKEAQKSCSNNCECIKSYDNCFSSCGGTLRYEKICVENCK